jgi:outer membrane protein insertion porin family
MFEKSILRTSTILFFMFTMASVAVAQDKEVWVPMDYENPREYIIGGIEVSGCESTDRNLLVLSTNLRYFQKITIPGDELRDAAERILNSKLYSNVEFQLSGIRSDTIFLLIKVEERGKLLKYGIRGLGKQETKSVREEISLKKGEIITEGKINKTRKEIEKYFEEKGFYNVKVDIRREMDDSVRAEILHIHVNKGRRVKVYDIQITGNDSVSAKKLRRLIKPKRKKKKWLFFQSSKLVKHEFDLEKEKIVQYYRSLGYRDAELLYDSIQRISDNRVNIKIGIYEGNKYYFRNIDWVGNTLYSSGRLDSLLGIKRGDIFNQSKLETMLYMNPNGIDISSLYMDRGYLFFNINPIEVLVENDSIDLEIRIYEGKQATIGDVRVVGNDKTSDHVIMRSIRSIPGEKFSRSDIQRSIRELAALGLFDPEQLGVEPIPNPAAGTVDIIYKVVEKPSDQIEASGGFGGGFGFVGSVGLTLNNFSTRRMFDKGGWNPIPSGDGQRLTLRAQSNGIGYQAYNFSFTEPWLGGKKPNSLSVSVFQSNQSNFRPKGHPDRATFKTTGATVAFGKLLKWPDDYFTFRISGGYQRYQLDRWTAFGASAIGYTMGTSNSFSINPSIIRNSTSDFIYPRNGSIFTVSVTATPPLSLFTPDRNYEGMTAQDKFRWIEYHKWKVEANWYFEPVKKLVLAPAFYFGAVGVYNKELGYSPFEMFRVGGSGFGSWAFFGTEIIPTKGYDEGLISDPTGRNEDSDPIFSKYSLELRYPLSLNPSATVYGYTYFEAANTWDRMDQFNPFMARRAVGFGARLYLPMFGLLSFDFGWGLDHPDPRVTKPQPQFLFSIGQQF